MDDLTVIVQRLGEDLLGRLNVDGVVAVKPGEEEKAFVVELSSPDAALLIGAGGETLESLQHILRTLVQKEAGEFVSLMVDIEGYRQRRDQALSGMVDRIVSKVNRTGRPEALRPMTASERRVVHMKVKEMQGVVSESIGEGRERQVVIKPIMRDIR